VSKCLRIFTSNVTLFLFCSSALIYNNNLKNWNVTIDDVYKAALKNTPDLLHSKISSMAALFEKCGVNVGTDEGSIYRSAPSFCAKSYNTFSYNMQAAPFSLLSFVSTYISERLITM